MSQLPLTNPPHPPKISPMSDKSASSMVTMTMAMRMEMSYRVWDKC